MRHFRLFGEVWNHWPWFFDHSKFVSWLVPFRNWSWVLHGYTRDFMSSFHTKHPGLQVIHHFRCLPDCWVRHEPYLRSHEPRHLVFSTGKSDLLMRKRQALNLSSHIKNCLLKRNLPLRDEVKKGDELVFGNKTEQAYYVWKQTVLRLLDGEYDEETIHFGGTYMWKLPYGKGWVWK